MTTVSPAGLAGVGVIGVPSVTLPRTNVSGRLGQPRVYLSPAVDVLSATGGWGAGVAGLSVTSGALASVSGWGAITLSVDVQPDVTITVTGWGSQGSLGAASASGTQYPIQVAPLTCVCNTPRVAVLLDGRAVGGLAPGGALTATVGTGSRGNPKTVAGIIHQAVHPVAGNVTRNLD